MDETLGAIYRRLNRRVLIVGHYPLLETLGPPSQAFTRDDLRLVYVGRLSVDRGLLIYVEILRLLREEGFPARLVLAGSFTPAADQVQMETAAREAQVGEFIDFQGFLPSHDVPAFLRAATWAWRCCSRSRAFRSPCPSSYLSIWPRACRC